MQRFFRFLGVSSLAGATSILLVSAVASGQDEVGRKPEAPASKVLGPAGADKELQAVNEAYEEGRLQLERRRLESLSRLAARRDPAEASVTYEQIFRLAAANNLFIDAEPIAESVLEKRSVSATTRGLATLVKIIAECDRGAYEQSLETLRRVVEETAQKTDGKTDKSVILTSEKVELCDLYYQRLIHDDRIEIARKAFQLLRLHVRTPVLVDFVSNRLKRLELVGKPAPEIRGTDLDGRPFNLAEAKGKVVLVVFWASWCLPCADEIEELERVAANYRSKGFQLVGVNLDTLQDDGVKLETVLPSIRHFVLDYNVNWPNLINGTGDKNYAEAYGVTTIPSNTLIGRDGKVVQIDLVQKNMETVIARATAK